MIIKAVRNNENIDINLLGTKGYKAGIRVTYKCDKCGDTFDTEYYVLIRKGRTEKQYCRSCTIKVKDVVNKRKQTCINKYGQDNPMRIDKFVDKFKENNNVYDKQRKNFEDVKESFESKGYQLLSTEYTNRTQELEFICPKGHRNTITWSSWNRGSGCSICGDKKKGVKRRYKIEEVRSILEREGYELLSTEYINKYIPIKYRCPLGHEGYVSFGNWVSRDTRCSSCSHIVSKAELEIFTLLKSYFPDAVQSDRLLINPYELDIVIPSKKFALEYCGLYWHSERNGKDKNYHLNKLNLTNSVGYRLVTIFEDEWIYKKPIVISRLKNILGIKADNTIYARKCYIKEISWKESSEFLNNNHLQGNGTDSIRLGAFNNSELVSVMTFSKPNISHGGNPDKEGSFELNRFCSKIGYRVTGIASKLLKYYIDNFNPREIFSYADKRWSDGNLYYQLGFDLGHNIVPNYWYICGDTRLHRFNFRKSQLKQFDTYSPNLSEWEIMKKEGFDRIWDCGNLRLDREMF